MSEHQAEAPGRFTPGEAAALADALRALLGGAWVRTSETELLAYAYDATGIKQMPDMVAFPADTAEVAETLRLACRWGVPVIPRGAGTNVSGGTVPTEGGLVVSLQRLNRILAIDTVNQRAVVQPGVTNFALQEALAPHGFFFAPDPSSQRVSTIGGNVAENAGGPRCLKYGVTANHLCALELVLADGTVMELGSELDESPGYDLAALVCGSEGTMGIITRITVRILPVQPAHRTLLVTFDTLDDSSRAVSAIIAAKIIPVAIEMLDRYKMPVIHASGYRIYPPNAEAALIIEVDGEAPDLVRQVDCITAILHEHHAKSVRPAADENERMQIWNGRKAAFGAMARLSGTLFAEDVTVPRERLPEMCRRAYAIREQVAIPITITAHAGDGNLHPSILYDPADPEQVRKLKEADALLIEACLELGGSITGEHGVGIDKLRGMALMFLPAELDLMRSLRHQFDPGGGLNPGKKIPAARGGY